MMSCDFLRFTASKPPWFIILPALIEVVTTCGQIQAWGHCYNYYTQKKSWHNAKTQCTDNGGELPSFKNFFEYEELKRAIDQLSTTVALESIWIDLNSDYGTWAGSGDPVQLMYPTRQPWAHGEPTPNKCAGIFGNSTGTDSAWTTKDCGMEMSVICRNSTGREGKNFSLADGTKVIFPGGPRVEQGEADQQCLDLGGDLLVIRKEQKMIEIQSQIGSEWDWIFWSGAKDDMEEGRWVWPDYTAVVYKPWFSAQGDPDNAFRLRDANQTLRCTDCSDCSAHIIQPNLLKMIDVPCSGHITLDVLCEIRPNTSANCDEFEHVFGEEFVVGPALYRTPIPSVASTKDCALHCSKDPACLQLQWNQSNSECQLSDKTYGDSSGDLQTSSSGTTFLFQYIT